MPIDISIIIPCFDRVTLLKQTLKSVEAAIKNVRAEIILVDDGSSVPIAGQIPEFSHLPLKVIRQTNSGLTTARYNGLLAATGEYIQFLDSDDQVEPDKFDVQLREMRLHSADVSHTDLAEYRYDPEREALTGKMIRKIRHATDPAEFYVRVQPAPHSPVFRRAYLLPPIANAFIPLSRDYDSIGETWFYYNLSIYPATIIKINEPLSIIVHHDSGRLTDNWEIMGLCALALQYRFARHLPPRARGKDSQARIRVANAAFNTFKRLPYNMSPDVQNAFIGVWKKLGRSRIREINGGRYFSFLAHLLGPVAAARIYKRLRPQNYNNMRSITDEELDRRLKTMLAKIDKDEK